MQSKGIIWLVASYLAISLIVTYFFPQKSSIFILVLVYFAICIYIGYSASKNKSHEGFLMADRNIGLFQLTGTLVASFIGASTLLVYTAFVYTYGIAAFWMFIGFFLGFGIFGYFGVFLKKHADKKRYYTLSDYFKDKHGKVLAAIATLAIFIFYFGALSNQYIGGAKVLSHISGWSYTTALLVMSAIILIYTLGGGFRSVVQTDAFQYLLMMILPVILVFSLKSGISLRAEYFNIFNAGWTNTISFLLYGIFTNFILAELWQRAYAAKDAKTIKKAFPLAGLCILFLGVLFTYLGLVARTVFPAIDPDLTGVYAFTSLIPGSLLAISLVFMFAAIMSSADTILFVLAMNVSQDIISHKKKIDAKKKVLYTKAALVSFTILAILIALVYPEMVNIIIVYTSLGASLSPLVIISWLSKKPSLLAMKLSFAISSVITLVLVFAFKYISPGLGLVAVINAWVVYYLVYFFERASRGRTVKRA